jgi:hypothetical protein
VDKNEFSEHMSWVLGMLMTINRKIVGKDGVFNVEDFTLQDLLDMETGAEGIMIELKKAREVKSRQ